MIGKIPIFVSGLGVVSPIGCGLSEFHQGLHSNRSGLHRAVWPANLNVPWPVLGSVSDFDGKRFIKPRKALKVMCREIQFGYAAATQAIEMAVQRALPDHGLNGERLACVFGAETFQGEPEELISTFMKARQSGGSDLQAWGQHAFAEIPPLWMLKYLPNMAASHISIALDARGPNNTICQGDVSSALAIIEGADLLSRGWADVCVVGGTSSRVSPVTLVYRGGAGLSQADDPAGAVRPFSNLRTGTAPSEGAGALVLETQQHLEARGGRGFAQLLGWARGFSTYDSPNFSSSLADLIATAVDRAGISLADLGHINAHGTGTAGDDEREAAAFTRLGLHVPVIASKSRWGQMGPASPVVELLVSLHAIAHHRFPALPAEPQPGEKWLVRIAKDDEAVTNPLFVKVAFSEQGQMVALVFRGATEPWPAENLGAEANFAIGS